MKTENDNNKEDNFKIETGISHLKGKLQMLDLTDPKYDAVFDVKLNVRDPELYGGRVVRKIAELRSDKAIRNALVICEVDGEERAACGFIRRQAICRIKKLYPEEWKTYFAKIPTYVIPNCTERDRELVMSDHGSEETLNEYEVYLATRRLIYQNLSQKDICSALSKMYLALASASVKQVYMTRMQELIKDGYTLIGTTPCKTVADIQLNTFRGRFQKFQRIHQSPDCVREAFRKHVLHMKDGIPITYKMAEITSKLSDEDAAEYLESIRPKRTGEKKKADRIWGAAKLSRSRNNMKSDYFKFLLDASLGKEDAQLRIPDLDDELYKIQKAIELDFDTFWVAVEEILETGDVFEDEDKQFNDEIEDENEE